ncbi:MAG TPA: alpha-ketoglutarate-dependent dioxygenase AlkB [Chthoniobacteraceae bacterium]|nr:alpha-ketoglutarate-dependent dioxygenase AlkB [Chthoniobacteraceae bacterium]
MSQTELFANIAPVPEGLVYQPEFISCEEEGELIVAIEAIPFAEIRMHGVVAKRRAAHFGRGYEYNSAKLKAAPPIPEFLLPLRQRVARLAGRKAGNFAEVLVTDYPAGAGIGWHRDAPAFDIVVGVSLLSACTMQFRPWPVEQGAPKRRKPLAQVLEPRSVYILQGPSRTAWEHHIPEAPNRRYSITFRTLRQPALG